MKIVELNEPDDKVLYTVAIGFNRNGLGPWSGVVEGKYRKGAVDDLDAMISESGNGDLDDDTVVVFAIIED